MPDFSITKTDVKKGTQQSFRICIYNISSKFQPQICKASSEFFKNEKNLATKDWSITSVKGEKPLLSDFSTTTTDCEMGTLTIFSN